MSSPPFLREEHLNYLHQLDSKEAPSLSSFRAESLRMGGVYWALSAVRLLKGEVSESQVDKIKALVHSCFDSSTGGFGWSSNHDAHITATHYAMLIFRQLGVEVEANMRTAVLRFVVRRQRPNGAFTADHWGESDLRFSYDAACILSILGGMSEIVESSFVDWILSCQNFDGGFGPNPGLESHAAYTFCAVGALSIAGVPIPKSELLACWLAERQTPSGGFNGRPEKAPDVCYSWWILSALEMLGKASFVDKEALAKFILRAQDKGGIADRPDCVPDVFHTFFGLAGLSLVDRDRFGLAPIDLEFAIVV